ncbi:MAG: hypothetical protein JXR34_11040 [Bacteroidales bacterium]|nr:hypothetical protein [Bacteroidales bacterium]
MKKLNLNGNLLVILLGFLSIGAIYGGLALILKTDGSFFKMTVDILHNSPFKNFLIPGIILLFTFGIIPIFILYAIIKRPDSKFFQKINLLYDYHFSWTFSVYIGFALIIWINVQTLFFNAVEIIHTIYSTLGILIICLALLPKTRQSFKL